MIDAARGGGSVAVFFDLDGTLVPGPSLERRFFGLLRYRGAIGGKNYLRWLVGAAALAPKGIAAMIQGNKSYLRDVEAKHADDLGRKFFPALFEAALQRIAWHARCGHAIVIVSGTLQPLAQGAALRLTEELAGRGVSTSIQVCGTQLAEIGERWTGKIVGEAMYGKAKAGAVRRIAAERRFDLRECFAYGDSIHDRWMLEEVGRPNAANPSPDLLRMARRQSWPTLWWASEPDGVRGTARAGVNAVASMEKLK